MIKKLLASALVVVAVGATGCATRSETVGTVGGAAVGGIAGSALTGGSAVGTVGGAAAGALIGNEVGRRNDDRRY
jgi:osmotically inducible lipoprotein OsmB